MAFVLDTKTTGGGTSNPLDIAITCSSSSKLLVLFLSGAGAQRAGTAPTYNSVAMTASGEGVTDFCSEGKQYGEVWYLPDPSTGSSYNVSIPNTGSAQLYAYIFSFETTGDVTKHTSNSDNCQTANPMTIDLSITTSGLAFGALCSDRQNPTGFSPGTGFTEGYVADVGGEVLYCEYDLDSGTGTVAVPINTGSADDGAEIAISFEEAGGGPSISIPVVQHHRQQQLVGN